MKKPRAFLLLLLLIRPSVDIFAGIGLRLGPVANLNINAIFVILVISFGVIFMLVNRQDFLDRISKLFVFYLIFTFIWGISVSRSLANFSAVFLRQLSFFIVFYLSFRLFNKKEYLRKLTAVCILSSVVPLVMALRQVAQKGLRFPFYLPPISEGHPGIQGTFSHPSGLAIYLMIILSVSCASLFAGMKKSNILKWTAITCILFFFLILTYYRTTWLGFLGALLAISFLKYRKLLIPVFLLALISSVAIPSISQRLTDLRSWYWRLRLWKRLLLFLSERNILEQMFGQGLGSISVLIHDIWGMSVVTSHNTYIKVLFETGILGICLFLSMRLLILKKAYSLLKADTPIYLRTLSIAVFGMSVSLLIAYIAQTIAGSVVLWYYWTYAGALYGTAYQLIKKKIQLSPAADGKTKR